MDFYISSEVDEINEIFSVEMSHKPVSLDEIFVFSEIIEDNAGSVNPYDEVVGYVALNSEERSALSSISSDPKKSELHPEAADAYEKANDHYKNTAGHVYEYIIINSGVRNVTHQYGLYRKFVEHKFFGGPSAPAANQPGSSNHEYGLAIDIVRKNDEARLTASLEANLWEKHDNPAEPWHFDAKGIASYAEIQSKIASVKAKYSSVIANELFAALEAEKKFKEKLPGYQQERARLIAESERLTAEQEYLNGESSALQRRQNSLRNEIANYNRYVERNRQLRRRIENFRYTYCPNGNSFDSCSHNNEKNRYIRERNRMVNQYNAESRRLQSRRTAIEKAEPIESRYLSF